MKVAYADPPYIGQARNHYRHEEICAEVDHRELIGRMCAEYDCWALSCSSPSLQQILVLCPPDVRIGAWVKPWCSFKPNVKPAYAWEPVVFWHPRKLGRNDLTVRDWVSANITMKKGLAGVKPTAFCMWLFAVLGMRHDDEFFDLYPGSGGVGRAWETYRTAFQMRAA